MIAILRLNFCVQVGKSHLMTLATRKPRRPLHERVAARLRNDVLSPLQPGDRLRSEADLARQMRVSVLTLRQALSVLAHEGMIERRHGSGTYITDHRRRKGVAVGTVAFGEQNENSFQTRLFIRLSERFRDAGYRCRCYVAPLGFLEGWAELAEDVEYGRIMGAAFVSMNAESIQIPFAERGVPYIAVGPSQQSVQLDAADLVRSGVRHLVSQGCRRIGCLQWMPTRDIFRAALAEHGLPVVEQWIRRSDSPSVPGSGWRAFREMWSARDDDEKPDGLLVTDDVLFRDVAMAILNSQIDVPGQLKIVTHANKGSGLSYPFPVSFMEVDIDEWADAMVRKLIMLMNQKPATSTEPTVDYIRAKLIPAGAVASPYVEEARTIRTEPLVGNDS